MVVGWVQGSMVDISSLIIASRGCSGLPKDRKILINSWSWNKALGRVPGILESEGNVNYLAVKRSVFPCSPDGLLLFHQDLSCFKAEEWGHGQCKRPDCIQEYQERRVWVFQLCWIQESLVDAGWRGGNSSKKYKVKREGAGQCSFEPWAFLVLRHAQGLKTNSGARKQWSGDKKRKK